MDREMRAHYPRTCAPAIESRDEEFATTYIHGHGQGNKKHQKINSNPGIYVEVIYLKLWSTTANWKGEIVKNLDWTEEGQGVDNL